MVSATGMLIIAVPGDNGGHGSVVVEHDGRTRVVGPEKKHNFGWNLGVNSNFMVVTAGHTAPVLVYQARHPHELKASIPLEGAYLVDVVIGTDNTIAVLWLKSRNSYVSVYQYDGQSIWHLAQKLKLEPRLGFSSFPRKLLGLSGSRLVVDLPDVGQDGGQGSAQVY